MKTQLLQKLVAKKMAGSADKKMIPCGHFYCGRG